MSVLNTSNITWTKTENYEVISKQSGTVLNFYNRVPNDNTVICSTYDTDTTINYFSKVLTFNFNSILIGGLGLGVIPQYIAENHSCEVIDIIEIDPNLIDTMTSFNIYDSKLNIIEGNINTYTPVQGYDLILIDIWFHYEGVSDTVEFNQTIQALKEKYNSYLNEGGSIYFPILNTFGSQDTFAKI